MKVLLINGTLLPSYTSGGTAYTTYHLAEALSEKCDVTVLTTNLRSKGGEHVDSRQIHQIGKFKVKYCRVLSSRAMLKTFSFQMLFWLLRNGRKYDAVLMNTAYSFYGVFSSMILKSKKIPYVAYSHGSFDVHLMKSASKQLWWKYLDKRIFSNADHIAALTQTEKDRFKTLKVETDCSVIPNGVETGEPESGFQPPETVTNFIGQNKYILFLGRVVEKKGPDILIRAYYKSKLFEEGIKLVIAGPVLDDYRKYLDSIIAEHKLEEHTLFPGPVYGDLKWWLLRHCLYYVLPSHSEGLPISVLEALK